MTHIAEQSEDIRLIEALHELIEALDRRIPDMRRAGERQIQEQATALRLEATLRIQELTAGGARH